ncbi:MAG: hypothetical protein Q8M79_08645, partial [Dehalococcoidia bacterium]|nr:hypothetical protein [Dehalococcoidia bacterium]
MSGTRAGPEAAPEAAAKAAGRDSRAPGTTPSEAPLIRGPRASLARTLGLHAGNSAAARVLGEAPPRGTAVQRVLSVQDPEGKVYSKIGEPGFAAEAHMALMENEAADYEDFNGVWGNYLEHPGTFEHYLFELVKAAQDYGSFDLSKPADVQRLYFQLKPLVMGDAGSEGPDVEAEAEVEVEPEARAAQPVAPAADSPLADYEPVMLEYQQRVLAQRTAAQEMQRLYDANVDALITAATPPRMADVPDEMRAQIGEAWAQITVFEVAVHGTKEGLQRLITEGEGHFSAAVDRVAGIQTEAGFQDWLLDMARANGQFQGVAEGLRDAMKELGKHAVGFAHIGRELGDADYVAGVLQV